MDRAKGYWHNYIYCYHQLTTWCTVNKGVRWGRGMGGPAPGTTCHFVIIFLSQWQACSLLLGLGEVLSVRERAKWVRISSRHSRGRGKRAVTGAGKWCHPTSQPILKDIHCLCQFHARCTSISIPPFKGALVEIPLFPSLSEGSIDREAKINEAYGGGCFFPLCLFFLCLRAGSSRLRGK